MLENLLELVHTAGSKIMQLYQTDSLGVIQKGSGINDVLTTADQVSHKIITTGLQQLGATQILSEESLNITYDRKREVWILDPIDGTRSFIQGTGKFGILLAKTEAGLVTTGIAHYPALNTTVFATKGNGCYLLYEGKTTKIDLAITGNDHQVSNLKGKLQLRPERNKTEKDMQILYSFAKKYNISDIGVVFGFDSYSLLNGDIDYFVDDYPKLSKRDVAAPSLLIQEAGGYICDLYGKEIDFSQSLPVFTAPILAGKSYAAQMVLHEIRQIEQRI